MLTLPEELLLLALRDKKGTVVSSASTALPYGLAGAVLLELSLLDRIALEKGKFAVKSASPTGDDLLDEALAKMNSAKKEHNPKYWVRKIAGIKKIKDRLLDRLVKQSILRREEHKVLWVIPTKRYPTLSASMEMKRREQIRSVVLHQVKPDERTSILISLIHACKLVSEVFKKEERKEARKRIKKMAKEDPVGKAVSDTVAGVQAAVVIAISASTVATSAGS